MTQKLNAAQQLHALWLAYETRIDFFSCKVYEFGRPPQCPTGTPPKRHKNQPGARRRWRDAQWAATYWNRWAVRAFGVHPKYRMLRHNAEIAMAAIAMAETA